MAYERFHCAAAQERRHMSDDKRQIDMPMAPGVEQDFEGETSTVSRRDVVRILGLAPFVGMFGWTALDLDRATKMVHGLGQAGAQQYAP
jgi:hypothetical protein